ncbi:hypothetical protein RND81_09G060300 [Saponaria officinalis]|uniref:Uncharacterized protein n=1 Tax=Saponaria officinalis TaxID=3572 RepID=A0AAW1II19_SAPOF
MTYSFTSHTSYILQYRVAHEHTQRTTNHHSSTMNDDHKAPKHHGIPTQPHDIHNSPTSNFHKINDNTPHVLNNTKHNKRKQELTLQVPRSNRGLCTWCLQYFTPHAT